MYARVCACTCESVSVCDTWDEARLRRRGCAPQQVGIPKGCAYVVIFLCVVYVQAACAHTQHSHICCLQAVADVRAAGCDCRVLVLGSGGGMSALMALRAGAVHVTVVER